MTGAGASQRESDDASFSGLMRIANCCENAAMSEEFVSEAIRPIAATIDASRMAAGGPGLPRQFEWRSQVVTITRVLNTWRETGPCHHGSNEQYVRKHWFE